MMMMSARIWTATCGAIALGSVVVVFAQNPPTSQSAAAKAITVTGCVQRAQQAPTGTSGTTGAAASAAETKFVLSNAMLNASGTAGTSGSTASPATASAREYRLDTDEAKLTPHVGHKVEITGTVEQPSRTEQKPPASAANTPTLKVDNVRMIASTCP
jgi:hypothetical protein